MTRNIVQEEIANGLREALRALVRPVAVITAEYNGQNFAMAATAFCEVSMDPPSMLVCVNRSNATFSVIADGTDIGLNFLADSHEELSKRCGGGVTQNAKFEVGDWLLEEGKPPRLVDSCAAMVLSPTQIVDHGTHAVVIGQITDVSSSSNRAPLSFHNGDYIFPLAKPAFN